MQIQCIFQTVHINMISIPKGYLRILREIKILLLRNWQRITSLSPTKHPPPLERDFPEGRVPHESIPLVHGETREVVNTVLHTRRDEKRAG
jgi:hypothetical protein